MAVQGSVGIGDGPEGSGASLGSARRLVEHRKPICPPWTPVPADIASYSVAHGVVRQLLNPLCLYSPLP